MGGRRIDYNEKVCILSLHYDKGKSATEIATFLDRNPQSVARYIRVAERIKNEEWDEILRDITIGYDNIQYIADYLEVVIPEDEMQKIRAAADNDNEKRVARDDRNIAGQMTFPPIECIANIKEVIRELFNANQELDCLEASLNKCGLKIDSKIFDSVSGFPSHCFFSWFDYTHDDCTLFNDFFSMSDFEAFWFRHAKSIFVKKAMKSFTEENDAE